MNTLIHNPKVYHFSNRLHKHVKPNTYCHIAQKPTLYGQVLHASMAVLLTFGIVKLVKRALQRKKQEDRIEHVIDRQKNEKIDDFALL